MLFSKAFMNAEEKDLVIVFLNTICFSREFFNVVEKYFTNTMVSEAAPIEMFYGGKKLFYMCYE
jgi:hypothetical protein